MARFGRCCGMGRLNILMAARHSLGHFILGAIFACACVALPPPLARADIEGGTEGEAIQVRKNERQTLQRGPTRRPVERSSNQRQSNSNYETRGSRGSNRSSSNDSVDRRECLNRSERLAAMVENRECDTSIEPEVVSNPRAQQPVPVSDSQPEVVSEPVEIVITASDLLELIPASREILMDRGPFGQIGRAHV